LFAVSGGERAALTYRDGLLNRRPGLYTIAGPGVPDSKGRMREKGLASVTAVAYARAIVHDEANHRLVFSNRMQSMQMCLLTGMIERVDDGADLYAAVGGTKLCKAEGVLFCANNQIRTSASFLFFYSYSHSYSS